MEALDSQTSRVSYPTPDFSSMFDAIHRRYSGNASPGVIVGVRFAPNTPHDAGNDLNDLEAGFAYYFANASNGSNHGAQPPPPTRSDTSNFQTPPPEVGTGTVASVSAPVSGVVYVFNPSPPAPPSYEIGNDPPPAEMAFNFVRVPALVPGVGYAFNPSPAASDIPPPADMVNALGVGLAYSFANASNGSNHGAQLPPPTRSYTFNVQTPRPDKQLLDDYKGILPTLLPVNLASIFAILQIWTGDTLSSYDRILICGIVCSAVAASLLSRVAHGRLHNPTTTHKWLAKAAITFTSLGIVGWMCILLPGVAKLVAMGVATLLCFPTMFAI